MTMGRLHRGLAILSVTGGLTAALVGSAGAAPRAYVESVDFPSGSPEIREQLIDDCLRDSNFPAENEVLALNNAPGGRVNLLCGNEVFGARHIHAGHPINNSDAFATCWLATIATNDTRPGNDPNGSTEWHHAYAPGKEAVVVTANAERDTLTAYTTGPNSADWEGCGG